MLGFVGYTLLLIVAFGGAARVDASVIAHEPAEVGPLPDDVEAALFFGEQPGPATCSAVQETFDDMKCRLYNGMLPAVHQHFAAHAAMWTREKLMQFFFIQPPPLFDD